MILHCIPENASRCYIMLALIAVPCSHKIVEKNFAFFVKLTQFNLFFEIFMSVQGEWFLFSKQLNRFLI